MHSRPLQTQNVLATTNYHITAEEVKFKHKI
jgi:hypothetical protein